MSFNALLDTQPDHPGGTSNGPTQDTDALDPIHSIISDSICKGVKRASPPMWFLLPTDQFHKLQTVMTPVVPTHTPVSVIHSTVNRPLGSRGRRLEARHFQPTDRSYWGILVRSCLKTPTWWIYWILRYRVSQHLLIDHHLIL